MPIPPMIRSCEVKDWQSATVGCSNNPRNAHVVSPTHVLRPGASSGSLFTSEVSKDRPCDEVGDELCERPKGGKNLHSIRRSVRDISIRVDTHHLLTTRRYWCEPGKNSKKMAESTGKLLHASRNLISDFARFLSTSSISASLTHQHQHSIGHQRHRRRQMWAIPPRRDRKQRRYRACS